MRDEPEYDPNSDDEYDARKDAYLEGWGRPYNERTRREAEQERYNERWDRW